MEEVGLQVKSYVSKSVHKKKKCLGHGVSKPDDSFQSHTPLGKKIEEKKKNQKKVLVLNV